MKGNHLLKCLSIVVLAVCVAFFVVPDCMAKKKKDKNKTGDVGTTVTLVTTGTGSTKEDAIKNALRTALEQTYGAFVSSNTQMINDELVKDEIVSISTGNVVKYEELAFLDEVPKQVTVKAVISVTKLINYAKNKGMSTELAGSTFAMNVKLEELNKQNQKKVLENLLTQTIKMAPNLFDYKIQVRNPINMSKGVEVPVTIFVTANKNTVSYFDMFHKTLSSVLSSQNLHGSFLRFRPNAYRITKRSGSIASKTELKPIEYGYDGNLYNTIFSIRKVLTGSILLCEVVDNLGNVSGFKILSSSGDYDEIRNHDNKDFVRCQLNGIGILFLPTNKLSAWSYDAHREETGSLQFGDLSPYRVQPDGSEIRQDTLINKRYNYEMDNYWLGIIPVDGETLYKLDVCLHYTMNEISKISKITIRPKFNNNF